MSEAAGRIPRAHMAEIVTSLPNGMGLAFREAAEANPKLMEYVSENSSLGVVRALVDQGYSELGQHIAWMIQQSMREFQATLVSA
ncbi:MAG TPA: hypothetical protein VFT59_06100 [Candidatus Saccharimonadales bacterium]|nr:hypothetical protein [Candidatus Saccharimonadales bacterium]